MVKCHVDEPVIYLSAEDEDGKTIAQANAQYDEKGTFHYSLESKSTF